MASGQVTSFVAPTGRTPGRHSCHTSLPQSVVFPEVRASRLKAGGCGCWTTPGTRWRSAANASGNGGARPVQSAGRPGRTSRSGSVLCFVNAVVVALRDSDLASDAAIEPPAFERRRLLVHARCTRT